MKIELNYIRSNQKAAKYAMGCLLASFKERANDFDTRFVTGLWSVVLITSAFAFHRVDIAWRGMLVIMGRPDPLYDALQNGSSADKLIAAAYHDAVPIVVSLFFGLGITHLIAAYFLARLQLRLFVMAWCAGFLIAIVAVTIQLSIIWGLNGIPSEFIALLIQIMAVPMLFFWSKGRHHRLT